VFKHYSKLVETTIKSKAVHRGIIGFNFDTVRLINGKTATREYVVHPGASAILPVTEDKIVLVQQFRYPVREALWELPAGKIKPGQSPLVCARAELAEETGYRAAKIKKLLTFYPASAFSDEALHIFIASGLKSGQTNPDEDEFLNTKLFPLKKAYEMVKKGQIKDAKTIIALLYYKAYLEI
jgi:ADP-ribose pyrophosphatase